MSYESKLNNQFSKLINPAQLCLLLSVSLHLLVLKFGLPTIRFNRDGGEREVSIIELNPEQQARLPDLYPQLPNTEPPSLDLPTNDLSEPVAPFAIPPNLIPGITDPANLPPLIIPPPPTFNFPDLPPVTDITLPPVGDLSDLPLPPDIDPLDFQVEPIKLPPNLGKLPEPPTGTEKVETAPTSPPNTTATKIPEQPTDKTPDKIPPTTPQETPEEIATRKLAASQQRIKNLRQSLTKTNDGTNDEEARKNYVAWLTKVKDIEPEVIKINGVYPRDACIKRLKGNSVFGVVVNAQGKLVAIDLLKGAKYPIFNQEASKELSDRIFDNDTEKPKPYQVQVNYEYDADICPSLTLPAIKRQQEQPPIPETKPQPQPKPPPSPESKPEPQPQPKPQPQSIPTPEPEPELPSKPQPIEKPISKPENPSPSLRDRLRNVPLPNLDPSRLKDIPLPEKPNFN